MRFHKSHEISPPGCAIRGSRSSSFLEPFSPADRRDHETHRHRLDLGFSKSVPVGITHGCAQRVGPTGTVSASSR